MNQWIAVRGSRQVVNTKVRHDVKKVVGRILSDGDGIVLGGFPGVDYLATKEALKLCPAADRIRLIIPAPLVEYAMHFDELVATGFISDAHARAVILQLAELKQANPRALKEIKDDGVVCCDHYDSAIIERADALEAFCFNSGRIIQESIFFAHAKGIPVRVRTYEI